MRHLNAWIIAGCALVGLGATLLGGKNLNRHEQLMSQENPFGLYESAYGMLLARLGETTIDRIWHLGIEQIVPHYMSGKKHGAAETRLPVKSSQAPQKPLIERSKRWVQDRVVAQHQRTNPYSLSDKHLQRVYKDIKQLIQRSHRLDPTHYGAYNSYHLFITTHAYGGTIDSRTEAMKLARKTIDHITSRETENPEAFLTAAAALMNAFIIETEDARVNHTQIPVAVLERYRDEMDELIHQFETLHANAEESGAWDDVSTDRQVEITQRYRFTKRTADQFQALIARANRPKSAAKPTAEVAEKSE